MDTRRLLIAALLSLGIMVLWGYLFPPSETEPRQLSPAPAETADGSRPVTRLPIEQAAPVGEEPSRPLEEPAPVTRAAAASAESAEDVMATAEERVVLTGETYRAEFTNRGAQLVSFQLSEHFTADGGPVDLVRERAAGPYLFGFASLDGASSALNEAYFKVTREITDLGHEVVVFRYQGPLGSAEKRFSFQPNGLLDIQIASSSPPGWAVVIGPGVRNPNEAEMDNRFARRSATYLDGEGVERIDPGRIKASQGISAIGLQWVALQDTYFVTAVIPQQGLEGVVVLPALVVSDPGGHGATFRPFRDLEQLSEAERELGREIYLLLQPQGTQLDLVAFLGAKQYERLAALPYGLEETVQLGWFKFLSLPLLWGLHWIHENVVANYGWAIILMTILIRVILFPLTHKSTVSMQKMQEINPKVQAIRQKYKPKLKDKKGRPNPEMQRKMNEETMALYKEEGVNPAGGCLPMVLQIPVLFAFYNILSAAIEIRHAPWIFWITDLSAKDPYYVLPLVMGATQFLQQKMTPAAGDPMQRRMFALMPIFFTILFLGFPSGLVLYWLTNNVLGIGQQYLYKRMREAKADGGKSSGNKRLDRGKRGSEK